MNLRNEFFILTTEKSIKFYYNLNIKYWVLNIH